MKRALIVGSNRNIEQLKSVLSQLSFSAIMVSKKGQILNEAKNCQIIIFDADSLDSRSKNTIYAILKKINKDFIVISNQASFKGIIQARNHGALDYIVSPYHFREFIARFNAAINRKNRICCIGGGTGLFNLLIGLKKIPDTLLTSIVSMSDDGGSSGRLRESFGVLPPGDVRRSLVALSNAPEFMYDVMQYRFKKGGSLSGHNFGNLFLTVLAEVKGSMSEAVKGLGDILNIQGIVLPVTSKSSMLCAEFEDGTVIRGESNIDLGKNRNLEIPIKKIWHEPKVKCEIEVVAAIIFSDLIIIGPGDLYTSVITNLLVNNVPEAITKANSKKVYICNLMTKPGETSYFDASDHIKEIIKYLRDDLLDFTIISDTFLSKKAKGKYAKKGQFPVEIGDLNRLRQLTKSRIIITDVGHETDLVRHDSSKLKIEIAKITQLIKK